jgi:hypothetical protein
VHAQPVLIVLLSLFLEHGPEIGILFNLLLETLPCSTSIEKPGFTLRFQPPF